MASWYNKENMMKNLKRRDFLKLAGGVTVSSFAVPESLFANDGGDLKDFKALVVLDMHGGNDALNMFVPADATTGSKTGYDYYAKARSSAITIEAKDLMGELRKKVDSNGNLLMEMDSKNIYFDSYDIKKSYVKGFYLLDKQGFDSKVAINPLMPELAYWFDRGKGAIVQNVGSISAPATKQDLRNKKVRVPPFIFAHNQQAKLMKTGQAASINIPTGWLGRAADKWTQLDYGGVYKMNISLSTYGRYEMFFGNNTNPMAYSSRGPVSYDSRVFSSDLYNDLADAGSNDMFHKIYNKVNKNMISQVNQTISDWKEVVGTNDIFSGLKDSYGVEYGTSHTKEEYGFKLASVGADEAFATAARLIKIAKKKGFPRVAISITVGGYDQHSTQSTTHSRRIRSLSLGIDRFMRSLEHIGASKEVTLFTVSEFGRSTGSNSDGTDHAWGAAYMVLGGAVKSGNYGTFPDLTLGGDDDYSNKGRLIPSTSYTQYFATLLKWFGADDAVIDHALPELKNFKTRDLGFMS
jgi:uncharacterized protein (DUF1501 family)